MSDQRDALDRLINPANLRKELGKWKEHQRDPLDFVKKHKDEIVKLPLYDRPSVESATIRQRGVL